jgi:DNA-directed RNA polymerase (rpoE), archaeal and eukaryotic form
VHPYIIYIFLFPIIYCSADYKRLGESLYKIYTIRDTFKLPPSRFGENIEKVATEILRSKYEGRIDKDMGILLVLYNVRNISDGIIMPGDPSTKHDVTFDMLTFLPVVGEIVVGEVSELAEFGAFIKIGPIDGLAHVSQIIGDFISFDKRSGAFVSKRTGKSLKKGDMVYAKISTISLKKSLKDSKIALTMKPTGLGRPEWIISESKKQTKEKKQIKSHK